MVEGRLALRLATLLDARAQEIPHDIGERLRVSRMLAVERARLNRKVLVPATSLVSASGVRFEGEAPSLWLRLASVMPLVVLVVGMLAIQHHSSLEQIAAAAEIDSALLTDELPPAAYGDLGFAAYLREAELR